MAITKRYSQNILDWEASEALAYLYGCTNMVLLVSPLCDANAAVFLSLILVALTGLFIYRLVKANQFSDFLKVVPGTLVSTVKRGCGLAALAVVLKFLQFHRLEPEGLWLELLETLAYLVVMGTIMIYSIQTPFLTRYRDAVDTEVLVKTEKRLNIFYYFVVVRIMMRQQSVEDVISAGFMAYTLFQTSFVWSFGFQPAKIA